MSGADPGFRVWGAPMLFSARGAQMADVGAFGDTHAKMEELVRFGGASPGSPKE